MSDAPRPCRMGSCAKPSLGTHHSALSLSLPLHYAPMSVLWAFTAFLMTIAGGAFAFRYQRYLLFIMAFSAGLLIGVVFLDIIPEVTAAAFHEALNVRGLMVTLIAGFVAIFLLEKLTIIQQRKAA